MNLCSNYLDGLSITSNRFHHICLFPAGCKCTQNTEIPMGIGITTSVMVQLVPRLLNHLKNFLGRTSNVEEIQAVFFLHNLTSSTTDILMRICRDQDRADEDHAITNLKLYVM